MCIPKIYHHIINENRRASDKYITTLDKIVLVACAPTYVHQLSQQISTYLLLQIATHL